MHFSIGVIRGGVAYHRHVITQLGGIANGCFDTGMRDQANNNELVDAVLLEL